MNRGNTVEKLNSGTTLGQISMDKEHQSIRTADNIQTSWPNTYRDKHKLEDWSLVHQSMNHWRNCRHTENTQNPIVQTTTSSVGANVEVFAMMGLIQMLIQLFDFFPADYTLYQVGFWAFSVQFWATNPSFTKQSLVNFF